MKTVKQKQTIVGLVISIICLLMFTTAMTFAYFTARNSAESDAMQFGTLEIVFTGNGENKIGLSNETTGEPHALVPGCTISVTGEVTLGTSTIDAFVRLKPEASITSTWGNDKSITKEEAESQLNALVIGAFERTNVWLRPQESNNPVGDYVYYAGKFLPSTSTATDGIKAYNFGTNNISFEINKELFGNDWQGCEFAVTIVAEAIQADHVGVTLTGTAQTDVNAIAGAKNSNEEQETAWNGVGGNEGQNNSLEQASLQYLDFTVVDSTGASTGAELVSESANEMPTLNGGKVTASNLMADGTKFVSVKSKTDVNQATGDIAIPEYIKVESGSVVLATKTDWENNSAYKVTSIGSSAFYNCSGLTSITIPNNVTSIGNYAFYRCSGLTSVTIPNNVTSIEDSAFQYCSGLTGVTLGRSITSIGTYALSGCSKLTSITIPNSVISIGERAFHNCKGLKSITIPECVTSIGGGAFYNCTSLESITIPNSVTSMGGATFYGCSKLTSITIPECVTSIGGSTFYGCKGLTSITIPECVTSIGESAFQNCSGLTSITIPSSVTSIGYGAFSGCTGLTSIIIPDSVRKIGDEAFSGCYKLASINIAAYSGSSGGLSIGANAFNYTVTGGKKTFIITGSRVPSLLSSLSLGNATNITKIYVSAGMKDSYNTGIWKTYYYAKIEELSA